jgi:hypothetical protein
MVVVRRPKCDMFNARMGLVLRRSPLNPHGDPLVEDFKTSQNTPILTPSIQNPL